MVFLIAFCFGAMVGSFMNVCIFRLPKEESIVFPASHCQSCRKPIQWYDNIPCLSFLMLRGRCRHCRAKISWQYFFIELLSGALFVLFYQKFGLTVNSFFYLAMTLSFVVVSAIDFRHRIIPDGITLPGILIGLAASAVWPSLHGQESWKGGLLQSFVGIMIGGGFLYLAGTLTEIVLKREAMGGGDVKLLAMIGALLGWKGVLWTIFVSSVLGSVVGVYQRVRYGEMYIPYGPYLAGAAFLYLFYGPEIFQWYLGFIGFTP